VEYSLNLSIDKVTTRNTTAYFFGPLFLYNAALHEINYKERATKCNFLKNDKHKTSEK